MDERGLICLVGIYVSGCRVAVSGLPDRGDLVGPLALTRLLEIGDLSDPVGSPVWVSLQHFL